MNFIPALIFSFFSIFVLVLIYAARARRKPVKVSTLLFWQALRQGYSELPVYKKFLQEKLFYLHLTILILLLLSLIEFSPGPSSGREAGQRSIFIMDVSASMKTREGGTSRFEMARKKALKMLKDFQHAEVMVIAAGRPARTVLPFSRDRDNIIQTISDLEAEDTAADIQEAVLRTKPHFRDGDNIYLFSDGAFRNFSSITDSMPGLVFVPAGLTGENTGIQTLEIYRKENSSHVTAGVTLKNFGRNEVLSTVDLLVNGKVTDARRIVIPAGGEKDLYFDQIPAIPGNITARLNHPDPFDRDNERYAVQSLPEPCSILLVTRNNFYLKHFLAQLENCDATFLDPGTYEKDIHAEKKRDYDIAIYDNYVPPVETGRNTVHINPEQNIYGISWENEYFTPDNLYALREHPVMRYTDFSDVKIRKSRMVRSFEGLALLGSSGSPLIIAADRQGKTRVISGFDINESNFPMSINFPVFFTNLLTWLQTDKTYGSKDMINSGDTFFRLLPQRLRSSSKAVVTSPDGKERHINIHDGTITLSDTHLAGIYSISLEDGKMEFAVNISPSESDIRPFEYKKPQTTAKESGHVSSLSSLTVWKISGILALLLLMSENRIRKKLSV